MTVIFSPKFGQIASEAYNYTLIVIKFYRSIDVRLFQIPLEFGVIKFIFGRMMAVFLPKFGQIDPMTCNSSLIVIKFYRSIGIGLF